jgi:hypothetical protein
MSRRSASGRKANKHCKAAGLESFEFNAGVAESFFDSQPRQLSRPSRAVFDPIDRALGDAGSLAKIGLAPTQHRPAGADLGGKELPFVLNAVRRHIYFRVFVHERVFVHDNVTNKNPRRKVRRGSSNSYLDQAIRAGSRGERER